MINIEARRMLFKSQRLSDLNFIESVNENAVTFKFDEIRFEKSEKGDPSVVFYFEGEPILYKVFLEGVAIRNISGVSKVHFKYD